MGGDAGMDPGADAATTPACEAALECDDGLACNGLEQCVGGACAPGEPPSCDDEIACTRDLCSEEQRGCVHRATDEDGDGVASIACLDARGMPLGEDCDDDDANVHPGALEVCDAPGLDEDCDPRTHGGLDEDGDGFEDARCCNGSDCGEDCNDAVAGASPMGTEACNAIDDDCDGRIDEELDVLVYRDADGDGRGNAAMSMRACASTSGYSLYDDDCDDTSAARSPQLPEVCDGLDNDCDGTPDPADATVVAPWYRDADGDGFGDASMSVLACAPPGEHSLLPTDCDDARAAVHPGQTELCNGVDDDCNGVADFAIAPGDLEDDDADGVADSGCSPTPSPADCDDRDRTSGPGEPEACDGRDDDCDGRIDEDVAAHVYFRDADGDGYGSAASGTLVGCVPVSGYTTRGGDCDDDAVGRRPFARDACNGLDDDCDAAVDETPASEECGRDAVCFAGACRALCEPGYSDCNGDLGTVGGDGCETLGSCAGCASCAADEDCMGGSCVPCVPSLVSRPGATAPTPPVGLRVQCVDGPESFVEANCPVVQCGRLFTWPFTYTDNRFALGLSTYEDDVTFLRTTELTGPRYVYGASNDSLFMSVTFRGQHDLIGTTPWSTFRNP